VSAQLGKQALRRIAPIASALSVLIISRMAHAAPQLSVTLGGDDAGPGQVGSGIKMLAILTVLAIAPAIMLATTSFVRIIVVLSFLRSALGTHTTPPTQVMTSLALLLTVAVMAPVATRMWDAGISPYLDGKMDGRTAFANGSEPLKEFMLRQTRESDLATFYEISHADRPETADEVGLQILVPAFVLSELHTAFEMGFALFVPFVVVDLAVASVLMALGMVMVPPALVSLPVKLLLFVAADGWALLASSLVKSFA
jgi:flagellar biosynthetic protein FliP